MVYLALCFIASIHHGVCFSKHCINQFGKDLFCGAHLVANYIITQNIRIYHSVCHLIAKGKVKVCQRCGFAGFPVGFCINKLHISITDEIWAWAPVNWLWNCSKETLKQHNAIDVPSQQHIPHALDRHDATEEMCEFLMRRRWKKGLFQSVLDWKKSFGDTIAI